MSTTNDQFALHYQSTSQEPSIHGNLVPFVWNAGDIIFPETSSYSPNKLNARIAELEQILSNNGSYTVAREGPPAPRNYTNTEPTTFAHTVQSKISNVMEVESTGRLVLEKVGISKIKSEPRVVSSHNSTPEMNSSCDTEMTTSASTLGSRDLEALASEDLSPSTAAKVRKMGPNERALVLMRRRLRNRESAKRSRQQRMQHADSLQQTVTSLREEIDQMRNQLTMLVQENHQLLQLLQRGRQ